MTRWLVLGATGTVGSVLTSVLAERPDTSVVAVSRNRVLLEELKRRLGCETLQFDVTSSAARLAALPAADVVVDLTYAGGRHPRHRSQGRERRGADRRLPGSPQNGSADAHRDLGAASAASELQRPPCDTARLDFDVHAEQDRRRAGFGSGVAAGANEGDPAGKRRDTRLNLGRRSPPRTPGWQDRECGCPGLPRQRLRREPAGRRRRRPGGPPVALASSAAGWT